jgi:hypothetical protein
VAAALHRSRAHRGAAAQGREGSGAPGGTHGHRGDAKVHRDGGAGGGGQREGRAQRRV